MLSTKPYLIRAIYEWCTDQGFTPYLAVQVDGQTRVPQEFVRDGQIVLNISPLATHQMVMGNEEIAFQTRFAGAVYPVVIPVDAVVAIYARENGQGMVFEAGGRARADDTPSSEVDASETAGSTDETAPPPRRGGHLTRIK